MINGISSGLNFDPSVSSGFLRNNNDVAKLQTKVTNIENVKQDKSSIEIKNAAKDFEAMLLSQMMNEMWKSVPENSLFGKSQEESYFREMLNSEVSKEIAEGEGLGIQDLVIAELEKRK